MHFGTWGPAWMVAWLADSHAISKTENVFIEGALIRRRDKPFSGIGPLNQQGAGTRYSSTVSQMALGHEKHFWRSSLVRTQAGSRTPRMPRPASTTSERRAASASRASSDPTTTTDAAAHRLGISRRRSSSSRARVIMCPCTGMARFSSRVVTQHPRTHETAYGASSRGSSW